MFIKFGNEENIKDLYENGTVYMNSREYFRRIEDQELRGDSYEGVDKIKNSGPGSFIIPSIGHIGHYQNIHIPTAFEEVWGNIYSLYAICPETVPELFDFKMDERVANFGSHCLLIKDANLFIEKIDERLHFLNYKIHVGFVNYYDKKSFNGKLSVFDKPKEFDYQREFRFYIERDGIDPIAFRIGSLKDFSEVFSCYEILTLRLEPNVKNSL